jgi:lipoyl-dependent peroxiredoxin
MARVLYTAHANVTGGREDGHGRSADAQLEVHLRVPKEMGGTAGGTNPEELFAVGYAACFESALGTVARRRHLDAGPAAIDSAVSLLPDGAGGFKLAVALDVTLPSVTDPETAAQLIREAHQVCPYSNATRGNIHVELLLGGKPILRRLPGSLPAAHPRRCAMYLSFREQQLLDRISEAEAESDPRLASMLATFGRLTAGEAMPERDQLEVPAGRIKAALRAAASPAATLTAWAGTLRARARGARHTADPASPASAGTRRHGGRHARQSAAPDA